MPSTNLTAASKQARGIKFTEKNRNIITNDDADDDEDNQDIEENAPIQVADNSPHNEEEMMAIGQQEYRDNGTEEQETNPAISGVHEQYSIITK